MATWLPSNRWVLYESAAYLKNTGLHIGGEAENIVNERALNDNSSLACARVRGAAAAARYCGGNSHQFIVLDHVTGSDGLPPETVARTLEDRGHLIAVNSDQFLCDIMNVRGQGWREKTSIVKNGISYKLLQKYAGAKKGYVKPDDTRRPVHVNSSPKGGDPRSAGDAPPRRACIVRFGAIGDLIIATPLIRELEREGYEVTVLTHASTAPVLYENPRIANLLSQARNVIPNKELGDYTAYWQGRYDRYINLGESIEGSLLKVENRRDFYVPKQERTDPTNYYDKTLSVAGVAASEPPVGELFFTAREHKVCEDLTRNHDTFHVMWALRGSSWHKVYPTYYPLLVEWLRGKPDARVYLTGGSDSTKHVVDRHPQITSLVERISLREALCLTSHVQCVIGPETGMMNAAGCYDTPKILFMSHSAPESLTKYWRNTTCLEPEVPCYPCYQLHFTLESCPLREILSDKGDVLYRGPACTVHRKDSGAIAATRVIAALDKVYDQWRATMH